MQIAHLLRRKGPGVVTVAPTAPVREALALLAEHGIGALLVAAVPGAVDGVLSERDVVRGLHASGPGVLDGPVSALMTAEVRTCVPGASVHDLARTMTDHRVRHVPVVEDGRLLGIVSIGDVVKARLDELEEERAHLVDYIQTS
ncbi:CBS domain-containing protein [Geodermatophilus dictyosporus]|uniref:CBS domain-containing protein n=1 Tax=Geodermatophilus dictyosporus TaxID=1523247 RepID=A0A1I5NDU3_9ACTN|nr:CBS domain-containing protein [Geodermatophilus dictyosporus]SFP19391.1 CBS domain-containing protein [Geodermatophilus dictyosporus]